MASPSHDREPRKAPTLSVFNRRSPVLKTIDPQSWVNLRWRVYATDKKLFFASPSGRFTPMSGKVPSLYLSRSERTSFKELYGDLIAAARNDGLDPIIAAGDLSERVFVDIDAPALRLVDISTGAGLDAIGLDVGTAYHPVIDHSRAWAQVIHDHSINADGILYESRHTKELCAVVWARRDNDGFTMTNHRPMGSRGSIAPDGILEIFGERLLIAG